MAASSQRRPSEPVRQPPLGQPAAAQNEQWCSAEKPVSLTGRGGTRSRHTGCAAENRGQPPAGVPNLARVVQYPRMVAASCCWAGDSVAGKPSAFSVNRYWISEAWAAPYGKPSGGRDTSGAFSSANS